MKNIRVQGIFVGSREMFEAMNRAIALAKLKPVGRPRVPVRRGRRGMRVHGKRRPLRQGRDPGVGCLYLRTSRSLHDS